MTALASRGQRICDDLALVARPEISSVAPWPSGDLSRVLRPCDRPIPLLGAGVSAGCGLPTGAQLADWIRGLPLVQAVDFSGVSPSEMRNPLTIAQRVVDHDPASRVEMMRALVAHLRGREPTATLTSALAALVRTPNAPRLILTLNYDLLIEKAADQNNRAVETLGVADITALLSDGLQEPGEALRVLHLHGSVEDPPEQLVLDAAAYSERAGDERVRALFRTLLAYYNLCILGSSFEEQYLANVLLASRPRRPRHVIVCDEPIADRIFAGQAQLSSTLHNVLVCDYPRNDHGVLDAFCTELVTCPPEPDVDAPVVARGQAHAEDFYQPRRLIDQSDSPEQTLGDVELALAFGSLETYDEEELRAERRAVIVGDPGSGKTRLCERLAASPRQGERGVLIRLRAVRDTLGEPERLMAEWVHAGEVLDSGGPLAIEHVLSGQTRVHLLLDGLDELPREARQQVATSIVAIGKALPEQRLTLSSRPSAALQALDEDWRGFRLLCDGQWRTGLLARIGLDEHRLSSELGDLYATVEPLTKIPFFLRGLVDLLGEGDAPADALALSLALLRRQLRQDDRLRPLGEGVRTLAHTGGPQHVA